AARTHLRRHAARNLGHRREERQAAAARRDGFIGDAYCFALDQIVCLSAIGCEMQVSEQHMPLGDLPALRGLWLLHLDDELGLLPRIADARARLLVGRVGGTDAGARARLDHHLVAVRDELAY